MDIQIGTQWIRRRKNRKDLCTVIDIYKTYNNAGDLVKKRYISEHDMMGQKVQHEDVSTSILRGMS